MKKEHLENLISLAREIRYKGENKMDFSAFDTRKIEEYRGRAKEQWGNTAEYKESEESEKGLKTAPFEKTTTCSDHNIYHINQAYSSNHS